MRSDVESAATLVIILFVLVYAGAPIVTRARMRMSAHPEFEDTTVDDARVPGLVRAFLHHAGTELEKLQFAPVAFLINRDTAPNATGYILLFECRVTQDMAAAYALFAKAAPAAEVQIYTVEFITSFADRTSVITSNADRPEWVARLPWKHTYFFHKMADLSLLWRIHQAVIARRGNSTKEPLTQAGEHAQALHDEMLRDLQGQVDAGHMYLAASGEAFLFTWVGSLLNTWALLPPTRMIRRRRMRRQARALLRELGMPEKYPTVDYRKLAH